MKKYQFSYYSRIVFMALVYVIFFYFVITNIIKAESTSSFIFNIIVGVVIGGMALLYEYLRINNDAATKRLIVDGKPKEALEFIANVEQFDLFKTYKTSCQMQKMLALLDLRRFDELKEYTNQFDKLESNDYDVEIVSKYCQMQLYGETDNRGKSNEAFKKLVNVRDLRDKKGRRHKGAFYFNWEVVNGQHKNYEGDYQGAYNYLKDVNETNMNKRELMHYLLAKCKAAKMLKLDDVFNENKNRLLKTVNNNKEMLDYIESM